MVLEHVSMDGKMLPGCQGRLTVPGHVIECGWFLLATARRRSDESLAQLAIDVFISKAFEHGWDNEHGVSRLSFHHITAVRFT